MPCSPASPGIDRSAKHKPKTACADVLKRTCPAGPFPWNGRPSSDYLLATDYWLLKSTAGARTEGRKTMQHLILRARTQLLADDCVEHLQLGVAGSIRRARRRHAPAVPRAPCPWECPESDTAIRSSLELLTRTAPGEFLYKLRPPSGTMSAWTSSSGSSGWPWRDGSSSPPRRPRSACGTVSLLRM